MPTKRPWKNLIGSTLSPAHSGGGYSAWKRGKGNMDHLSRVPWEGGPAYWTTAQSGSKMTRAQAMGWNNDTFFPISIFLADPQHADDLYSLGINTYIGTFANAGAVTTINNIAPNMSIVLNANEWTAAEHAAESSAGQLQVVGLMVIDEPELNTVNHTAYMTMVSDTNARSDKTGRFLFTNFAHNIRRTFWRAGSIGGGLLESHEEAAANDAVCVDHYCYTSPGIRGDNGPQGVCDDANGGTSHLWPGAYQDFAKVKQAAAYGWQVRALNSLLTDQSLLRPVWVTIEVQLPYITESGRSIISHAQRKGAIWSAIVNEARGIMFFHQNGFYDANSYSAGVPADNYSGNDPNTGVAPNEGSSALIDSDPTYAASVSSQIAEVVALAPVLNTQSYVFDFGATGIETMLKVKDGFAYIFCTKSVLGTTGSKTFTLTGSGITGTSVEVVNESRSLSISGDQFSDTFANEYTVHIYKVAI